MDLNKTILSPQDRLGLFLKVFGWPFFSITVIKTCSRDNINVRENWYLTTFKPLLNILINTSQDPRVSGVLSLLTRAKLVLAYKVEQTLI